MIENLQKDKKIKKILILVKKTIRKYNLLNKNDRILVCVSGGKDSLTMLYILSELKKKVGFEIYGLTLDLGIKDFSRVSIEIAKENYEKLDIEYSIVKLKEYGFTLEDIAKNIDKFWGKSICGICSVIKRYVFTKFAIENRFNKVATGHTLDDSARLVLSFYLDGNLQTITRLYPITKSAIADVYYIKPLYFVPEKLTKYFVEKMKIRYQTKNCPYSSKINNKNIKILEQMEKVDKNSKEKLVKVFTDYVYPILSKEYLSKLNIKKCKICGMPTLKEICLFCRIREILTNKS